MSHHDGGCRAGLRPTDQIIFADDTDEFAALATGP